MLEANQACHTLEPMFEMLLDMLLLHRLDTHRNCPSEQTPSKFVWAALAYTLDSCTPNITGVYLRCFRSFAAWNPKFWLCSRQPEATPCLACPKSLKFVWPAPMQDMERELESDMAAEPEERAIVRRRCSSRSSSKGSSSPERITSACDTRLPRDRHLCVSLSNSYSHYSPSRSRKARSRSWFGSVFFAMFRRLRSRNSGSGFAIYLRLGHNSQAAPEYVERKDMLILTSPDLK